MNAIANPIHPRHEELKHRRASAKALAAMTVKRIREIKASYRCPFGQITTAEFYELKSLKAEATRLCQTAAHFHGRIHLKGQTREQQSQDCGFPYLPTEA